MAEPAIPDPSRRAVLAGTGLEGAPIVPVSAVTGEGLPDLTAHLDAARARVAARPKDKLFRLAVDRCFTAQLWNQAALWLADGIPSVGRGDPTNMFHIALHPDGFARRTRNFEDWSRHQLHQLDQPRRGLARLRARGGDDQRHRKPGPHRRIEHS